MKIRDYFNYKECEKIDALDVDAYIGLKYDTDLNTGILLETSWGDSRLDLSPIVKKAETDTKMFLDGQYLRYNSEYWYNHFKEREPDCIHGDDLSKIISMKLLKDVDQTSLPFDGDIYIYDINTALFKTFSLKNYMAEVAGKQQEQDNRIAALEGSATSLINEINNLKQLVNNLTNVVNQSSSRISALEALLAKPAGVPDNAVVTWGNVNVYSDATNTGSKNSGLYTHTTSESRTNDMLFS